MGEEIRGWPIWIWFPFGKTCRDFSIIAPRGLGMYGLESNLKLKFGGARQARAMTDVTAGVTVTNVHPETLTATTMSLETARDLSIPDLLRLLNEKLGLESARLQETPLPPLVATASLESEVSAPEWFDLHPDKCGREI